MRRTILSIVAILMTSSLFASFDWENENGSGRFSEYLEYESTVIGEVPTTVKDVSVNLDVDYYVDIDVKIGENVVATISDYYYGYPQTLPVDVDNDGIYEMDLILNNSPYYYGYYYVKSIDVKGNVAAPITIIANTKYYSTVYVDYNFEKIDQAPSCEDLSGVEFGMCMRFLGYAVKDGRCRGVSGCSEQG